MKHVILAAALAGIAALVTTGPVSAELPDPGVTFAHL